MPAADLALLSTLLDEALGVDAPALEGWLVALQGESARLAPALRGLLAGHMSKETDDLLERGPSFAPAEPAGDHGLAAGLQVGPYRLLRELGTGGMGAVWLAERADGQLQRKVALKLPHIGWARGLADRFAREREILSTLEHPLIARLYDVGVEARGRPYMALEYVEGQPIDAYCRERALPVTARLRLLLQVAEAVTFAHGRLVLHRDLKPANILVTADGQVRLLDFGVAKLMEEGRAAETALTQAAGRALTLDYASPEQIRGEAIGTASDVYSLGVVAFELLAGERPYRLKRGSAAELEEAITGQDLPLASVVATDPVSKKALRGDLDAILNKALKRSADERYATVDGLAQDWRRCLEGHRVLARPDTAWYRINRFASRQRVPLAAATLGVVVFVVAVGFGAAAVVIAALVAGLGAALLLARRATAERDRAIALADRNAAVNVFVDTLITRAARAGPLTADQLLERSEELIDHEIQGNAEHRAYVLGVLANCHSQLDNPARSMRLLGRALDVARGVADGALRDSLASRHALVRGQLGEMQQALATVEAILARRGTTPEVRSEAHAHRSVLASWIGDDRGALEHASEALRWYRVSRLLAPREEAALLANLGWAHLMRAQGAEAERHLAEGLAVYERLGLADSAPAVQLISTFALAEQEMGDLQRSLELFDRGLAIGVRATPEAPPSPYLVANRAYTLTQMGRFAEAQAAYDVAADVARQQAAALIVYSIRMCLVELFAEQGKVQEGEAELAAADAEHRAAVPDRVAAVFARQLAEARLALLRGHADAAIAVYSEALAEERPSAGHVNALLGRAGAFLSADRIDDAEADARAALATATQLQARKPASFRTGLARLMLARAEAARGRPAAAASHAEAALRQLRATLDPTHPALDVARRLQRDPGSGAESSVALARSGGS